MYRNKEECDYCQLHPWKEIHGEDINIQRQLLVHLSCYDYIPITHRLKLWFSDHGRATARISYQRRAESHRRCFSFRAVNPDLTSGPPRWLLGLLDEWAVPRAQNQRIIRQPYRFGFLLTINGAQVFKAKTRFSIWPIALECLNLPPAVPAKRQNMLCVRFIPGPKGPKNLDTFLYPLVKEFDGLQNGIPAVLNGSISCSLLRRDREFTLKGHICLMGADMIAREKVAKSIVALFTTTNPW